MLGKKVPDMKDHVYIACDLNNAEEKEMPILPVSSFKEGDNSDNVGITFRTCIHKRKKQW